MPHYPAVRLRRMRSAEFSRRLMQETTLSVNYLIYPMFVQEALSKDLIPSMPGINRFTLDYLLKK